jgi:hypothetical protein
VAILWQIFFDFLRLSLSAQYVAIWRRAIFGRWNVGGSYETDYLLVRLTDFLPTIWIESERITKGCKFASKGLKPLF